MNLENIHFLNAGVVINYKLLSRNIISILNTYSINFNLTESQITQATQLDQKRISANFHSGGCILSAQEFGEDKQKVFEMKYEGEGKRFKIEIEFNNSNPDGFISYFVEPDAQSTAFKKIAEELSVIVKSGTKIIAKEEVIPKEIMVEDPVSKANVILEQEPLAPEKSNPVVEVKLHIEEPKSFRTYIKAEHLTGNCACPRTEDLFQVSKEFKIEDVSGRLRKLINIEKSGHVLICKCEHCGSHLFYEKTDFIYLKMLNDKTADYLISMKSQIEVIVKDKGVRILREKILPSSK